MKKVLLLSLIIGVSIHIYLINTQFKSSPVSFEEYTSDMIAYANIRDLTELEMNNTTLDYVDLYIGVIEEDGVEKLIYFYHFIEEDRGIENSIYLETFDCNDERYELVNINNRKEAIGEFDLQTVQDSCDDSNAPTLRLVYSIKTHFLHNYISSNFIDLTKFKLTIESVKGKK